MRDIAAERSLLLQAICERPSTVAELSDKLGISNEERIRRDLRALERKGQVRSLSLSESRTKLWMVA